MDDPKVMNKLVFDYLAEHSSKKMANDFAKSVGKKNIQEKLDGIPPILHMVSELMKNGNFPGKGKRKSEEINGHGPTSKKAKPNSESDDSDDSSTDEEEETKKSTQAWVNGVSKKDEESSSDEDSSDDEEQKKQTPAPTMNGKKKEESSSEEDSSDEEEEEKPKAPQKTAAKKEESSSEEDSSDDDEDETEKAKSVSKPAAKKEESSSSEESDSDEEEEKKKPAQAATKKTEEESSSDDDSDSDEEEEKPATKVESKTKKEHSSDSGDSDDDDEDESDDSSEEEEEKKGDAKKENAKEEPMDVDDDFKITNNKTPNNSFNKGKQNKGSESSGECYIKMSGVPFRASVQELKDFFKGGPIPTRVEHSLNDDGRNSGHAFAAFDSEESAEKAMLKDRQYMGQRYVALYRVDTFGGSSGGGGGGGKRLSGYDGDHTEFCVKLSGAPFKTTEQEVREFFKGGDAPTRVQVILNDEGRSSGEILVDFESDEAVEKALLKDREYIGPRFVFVSRYAGKLEIGGVKCSCVVKIHTIYQKLL